MPTRTEAIYGAPCWVDVTSRDFAAARPFYQGVFGWEFEELGPEFGNYNIISKDGNVIGGAMQHDPNFMPADMPSVWSIYFAVEDMAASLQKLTELGGTITVPAMTVGDQGVMGEGLDSTGTMVGLWQPGERKSFDLWGEPGFPAWFELHTRDFDAATAFYPALLGTEVGTNEMGEGMRYHTLDVNGEAHAGIWDITEVLPPEAPAAWNVYFHVEDPDATLAKVRELGGTVVMEPEDTEYGRMASVLDPSGAAFNVIGDMPGAE